MLPPKEIALLRREITTLRRFVIPLKRIVLDFSKDIQKFSEGDLTLYFDDVKDHIDKVIEVPEESKETIEIFKVPDFMLSTEKSNKILAVLTILFTLSIPATVVAAYLRNECKFTWWNRDWPCDLLWTIHIIQSSQ